MKKEKYRRLTPLRVIELLEYAGYEPREAAVRLRDLQLALLEHLKACTQRRR